VARGLALDPKLSGLWRSLGGLGFRHQSVILFSLFHHVTVGEKSERKINEVYLSDFIGAFENLHRVTGKQTRDCGSNASQPSTDNDDLVQLVLWK
jgi:hypothetical protein